MPIETAFEETTTTELLELETLNTRVAAFAREPIAETLALLKPTDIARLAERDPELASRLANAQQQAQALALDAFVLPSDDCVEMALYLAQLSPPGVEGRLAELARTDRQLWALGEYLLARYPDIRESPERALGEGADFRYELLLAIVGFISLGAPRPAGPNEDTPGHATRSEFAGEANLFETVIVHGTAAKSKTWWREQPGVQNFWAYIRQSCPALYGAGQEFRWSGGITDSEREQGARDFIDWWNTVGAPKSLQVIAHSHGCNVIYLACVMEPKLHIANMVALGGPVGTLYPPHIANASRIARIHNIYSQYDTTQFLGSLLIERRGEGRTLGDSVNVSNYHVPWQDPRTKLAHVWHSDLHEEAVWRGNGLTKKTLL